LRRSREGSFVDKTPYFAPERRRNNFREKGGRKKEHLGKEGEMKP